MDNPVPSTSKSCPAPVTPLEDKADKSGGQFELDITKFCDASVLESILDEMPFEIDGSKLRTDKNYSGFDNNTGETYLYPTNLPIRQYQYNICKQALFKNTLVVLPTGLGKTFIAAVVMYNFFRWYPRGKIIFMAPTRPLVAQQVEACYKIMGIPPEDTVEMTGQRAKKFRSDIWRDKRVFYATPQLVQSDMFSPDVNFPFADIKLVVVDEAHKAQGKYAYTEVIQTINSRNQLFRVLALSATPGRQVDDVVKVVRNLLISHVEIRSENSIDVSPYTHKKFIRTEVIPLGPQLTRIRDEFIQLIDPYVRYLLDQQVCTGSLSTLNKGWLIVQQKQFLTESSIHQHPQHSTIREHFATLVSLYHALECLERHGWRVFINYFEEEVGTEKYYVRKDRNILAFLERLREEFGPNPFALNDSNLLNASTLAPEIPGNIEYGHPKYGILKRHLIQHFEKNKESRVIVFCEYRESVHLVHRLLLQHRPLIRAKVFVGKGNSSLGLRTLSQKEQMQVMEQFRAGACNTLIGTCVIEEGIDVCDVDLIVTFDISSKNPTRFVQRMGRTGRKRMGHVLLLATEGKEHKVVKDVLASKDKTNQKLGRSTEILRALYKDAPRLVPPEFDPKCVETFIKPKPATEEVGTNKKNKKVTKKKVIDAPTTLTAIDEMSPVTTRKRTKRAKKTPVGVQDVRNFFKPTQTTDAGGEGQVLNCPSPPTPTILHNLSTTLDTPTQPQGLDAEWKKLKNIYTTFEKFPVPEVPVITPDISSLIKSDLLSANVKKQLLLLNPGFVQDRLGAFKALCTLSDGSDCVMIEDDGGVSQMRTDVDLITSIFGGPSFVEEFLRQRQKSAKPRKPLAPIDENQLTALKESFVGLQSKIRMKAKRGENTNAEDHQPGTQMFAQTQYMLPEFINNDSRYSKQPNPSDPQIVEKLVFKTPKRLEAAPAVVTSTPKTLNPMKCLTKTPLIDAFRRMEERSKAPSRPIISDVLNFFLLDSIDDMFEEIVADKTIRVNLPTAVDAPIAAGAENVASEESVRQDVAASNNNNDEDDDDDGVGEQINTVAYKITTANNYEEARMETSPIMPPHTLSDHDEKEVNIYNGDGNKSAGIDVDNELSADLGHSKVATNVSSYTITQIMERLDEMPAVVSSQIQPKPSQKNLQLFEHGDIFATSDDDLFAEVPSSRELNVASPNPPTSCLLQVLTSPSIFRHKSRTCPSDLDETVVSAPLRNRRVIHSDSSDNDEAKAPTSPLLTEEPIDSETFLTCRTSDTAQQATTTSKSSSRSIRRPKVHNSFVLSQAADSDGGDGDEEDTATEFIDGLIASDESDIDDLNNTTIQARYLKSLRSPSVRRNDGFKIPNRPQLPPITANIFSQPVQPDVSTYKEIGDSFVVDEDDPEPMANSSLDELEQAELILKQRRRCQKKRKQRILRQSNDSSSDDDEELEMAMKKSKVEF